MYLHGAASPKMHVRVSVSCSAEWQSNFKQLWASGW